MGSRRLLENLRDTSGRFRGDVLESLWAEMPDRFRTIDLASNALDTDDLTAFLTDPRGPGFRIRFGQLPADMDREMAWCCWRIAELGGRVPVGVLRSLIRWLAATVEDHPELSGSLMRAAPREWERSIAAAYARRNGSLPGRFWQQNVGSTLRRCYEILWAAYDQRPWWRREVWDPTLDPRIPLRPHEPLGNHAVYFQQLEPLWLRIAIQWYFKVSLETGQLTWSTVAGPQRTALQVFADWIAGHDPVPPPWLREDPAGIRAFMLDFLSHVRALITQSGPNKGKPLSPQRVNTLVTCLETFYAFMTDHRETAAQVLDEPGWLQLGPYHAMLWRHGEKGRRTRVVRERRQEVIDDTAFSQIMSNVHLLGEPIEGGGLGDEQIMRILMLVARTGRRISEIRMLDREPLLPLDRLCGSTGPADGAFVAKLRYQQTKIEQAPDTVLVDAEIVAIIDEQRRWADQHLGPRWAQGVTPKYLFLGHNMNRNADKPFPPSRINQTLAVFARRLDVRDSAGRLVDFNRTHRFRHTKATSLLNAGVPLHVVQRYMGHVSPTMTMEYAETLAETHEREFLRYRKVTADGRDLPVDTRDLYDMLELDKRTDRILPNGWCLLPPRQACDKGNACLTCDKFATDASFLPELRTQQHHTLQLIDERRQAFAARTGQEMSPDNVWLAGRTQEHDALGRIIDTLEQTGHRTDSDGRAVRGAGVAARTDALAAEHEQERRP